MECQKFSQWIKAGSGNYKYGRNDGRYRLTCNTYRGAYTCQHHKISMMKIALNYCNKLDCEACYTYTASNRASKISEKINAFQKEAIKNGINVGKAKHLVLMPKKLCLYLFTDYKAFLKLRLKVRDMLQECVMFGTYIFTHIWVIQCKNCGREENNCECEEPKLEWSIKPHFHALGFGYMLNNKEFRKKFKNWIYRKFRDRNGINDIYNTAFYLLSHCAIWRKENGDLKPAYAEYGFLNNNELIVKRRNVKYRTESCKYCKTVLRNAVRGVEPTGDRPNLTFLDCYKQKAKQLGIKTMGLSQQGIEKKIKDTIYFNEKFKLIIKDAQEIQLGAIHVSKIVEKNYEIVHIEALRTVVHNNQRKYRIDKKKLIQKRKECKEYG